MAKRLRKYDSRRRREQASRTRATILDVAYEAFATRGYAGTTVAALADDAGVSVETIYKTFGGKAGIVRALYDRGLAGRGAIPAPERSDAMSARETDPRAIIRGWGVLAAEVSPRVSPILLVVRAAASGDPDLAAVLLENDDRRLDRMRKQARMLKRRGFLRAGMTVERAADAMWAAVSPELYELLVVRRGWTPEEFGDHVARTIIGVLLDE